MALDDGAALGHPQRYEALLGVSEALRTYHERDALFLSLARELRPVIRFDFLGLALFDERTGVVTPYVLESDGHAATPPTLDGGDQLTHWVIEHRSPLVIAAVDQERRFTGEMAYLRDHGASSICCLPLTTPQRSVGMLLAASREPHVYETPDVAYLSLVANQVALAIDDALSHDSLRASLALAEQQLQALETSDALLRALSPALDVRQVFEQVSTIARPVIPHDMAALLVLADDREHVTLHAVSGGGLQPAAIARVPESLQPLLTRDWSFLIYEDIQGDPVLKSGLTARTGGRGSLRVAIRDTRGLVAILEFSTRQPAVYTETHARLARRVADHLALALSHERLAERRRHAAALEERTANLELVDDLLATLAGVLDIRQVFQRVSEIARRVIPHDRVTLPLLSEDRTHVVVHAIAGPSEGGFPQAVPVPDHQRSLLTEPWEYVIHSDLQADPLERDLPPFLGGHRSRLLVPIRIQGELVGGLDFLSFAPDRYTKADVLIARRIADHVALALSHQRLADEAQRAAEARERAAVLERRVNLLTAEVNALGGHRRVVGNSPRWKHALKQATQVAATETTVLLLGDSGTGKEVLARFIHRASSRQAGPFVAINCAALPEQLLESELFGHERGAFTGAVTPKPGQLELAAGGVLFLDEVSEMSLTAQAKFLRVLQEREFQRLGGTRVLKSNVRVVAATNRDLQAAIGRGTFREDLYYRLHVFEIALPPLRERREDILPLSEAFLEDLGRAFGRPPAGISHEARQQLIEYHWPGNVRQLRNTLERAAILCEGGLITGEHLSLPRLPQPQQIASATAAPMTTPDEPRRDLASLERDAIERALHDSRHNKTKAARALGLTRMQLYVRLRKYGLE
jgi:transcriptional regulator with GAF, ATPase, and Fis domain